jgi:heme/copper-type cytochrome/quinol oxidase subunit 3
LLLNHYSNSHYLGFVFSIWYWHFVDAIWIFLFIIVYAWGNWSVNTDFYNIFFNVTNR